MIEMHLPSGAPVFVAPGHVAFVFGRDDGATIVTDRADIDVTANAAEVAALVSDALSAPQRPFVDDPGGAAFGIRDAHFLTGKDAE